MAFKVIFFQSQNYEQKHLHMRIEWHRGLPQPPNWHLQKNTVFKKINIQAQYKLKNDIVWAYKLTLHSKAFLLSDKLFIKNP